MASLLHVTDGHSSHKYYIDGRRCRRDIWHDRHDRAVRVANSCTIRRNGAWYHYLDVTDPESQQSAGNNV